MARQLQRLALCAPYSSRIAPLDSLSIGLNGLTVADHIEALDVDLVTSASIGERITDDIKRQVDESI